MKTKRLLIGIIGAVFLLITVFAGFSAFTVKEVNLKFDTFETSDYTEEINKKTERILGKNMVFVHENDIKTEIEKNPYLVATVKKNLPGTVSVAVKERREVFLLSYGESTLVLSDEGIVLSDTPKSEDLRSYIGLTLDGISVTGATAGKKLATNDDATFYLAIELACSVDLTDCIDSMVVKKNAAEKDISFNTYTSVRIDVPDFDVLGKEKVKAGFDAYTSQENDYIKTFNVIGVYLVERDGVQRIEVQWINPFNK